jgi:DNA (cytosine-5)-methyltransferase 1
MRYLSVCSGIEAASVAWKHLGWKAVALSEIEKFPCEVLKHHYPDVPNLGDMTLLTKNEYLNGQQIDLLVGGTPCQSFSVAGLRAGLDDERGNLAIEYIRLLEHKRPKWFLWENVPGVLSSNGGADFASILSGWTGRDIAPQSFGISGVIEGQFYSVAWRVLDSRHFGVPQRRRRVFVVGYIGKDWRPPVAVLFERESLRRDFTPSGSKRKRTPKGTEGSTGVGSINCKPAGISGAMTSKWAKGNGGPAGDEHYNLIVTPSFGIQANIVDRSEKSGANGLGVKEEEAFTLTKGDRQCVMQPMAFKERGGCEGGGKGFLGSENLAFTLSRGVDQAVMQPANSYTLGDFGGYKEGVGTLRKSGGDLGVGSENIVVQPVEQPSTFRAKITLKHNHKYYYYEDKEGEKTGVIIDGDTFPYYFWKESDMACDCNLAKFVGLSELPCGETIEVINVEPIPVQPIVYDTTQITCPTNRSNPKQGDPCHTLAKGGDAPLLIQPIVLDDQGGSVMSVYENGQTGTLRAQTHGHEPIVCYSDTVGRGLQANDELAPTAVKFWGTGGGNVPFVQQPAMVRRLTPLECERLQGFPDNYSAIPSATDSKRYAALGNSMTVNVMKWIGERIDKVDKIKRNLC